MKASGRQWIAILALAATVAQPLAAFDYPLSSKAIREAYFLGAGDPNRRAEYFAKYTRRFPPEPGPHVGMIQFETPYLLIAEYVSQQVSNYFAQDAEEDFLGKPAVCRVRVQVYFNDYSGWPSAPPQVSTRFQTDYTVRLVQNDEEIASKRGSSEALYSSGDYPVVIGLEMDRDYDAEKISSTAPATVNVIMPDGQEVDAAFNLVKLR